MTSHFVTNTTRILRESVVVTAVVAVLCVAGLARGQSGTVPPSLPKQFLVGMQDTEPTAVWLPANAPYMMSRYRYLVSGWVDNWNPGSPKDGRFARTYLNGTPVGVIPTLTWYRVLGLPGGGESETYAKIRSAANMTVYFSEFRTLMQVCKTYGRVVIVHIEPDGLANIQIGSGGNVNAPAAIASTGLPELSGLPNSVSGFGQAFGRIRAAVGANNVLLAPHYSTWSTGTDLMRGNGLVADIATHVGRTADFLTALGTYDLIMTEWLDRDSAFRNIWWDTRADAGVGAQSFNRDLAIFAELNRRTGKRLLGWQIPWGGDSQRNVAENGTRGSGYKSIHVPYIFGPEGKANRDRMIKAGMIGVLVGAGATGQSTHRTSIGLDGGLWSTTEIRDYFKPTTNPPVCTPVCVPVCVDGGTTPGGTPLP